MKKIAGGLLLVPVLAVAMACQPSQSSTVPPPSKPVLTAPTMPAVTPPPVTHPSVRHTTPKPTATDDHTAGSQCHFRTDAGGYVLPDPSCTPGAVLTTSVTAVCTKGWASAHREYFTKAEREKAFWKYGVGTSDPAAYGEYDHLIPLELGGSNSPSNLWPEHGSIPNAKDAIENALHDAVCSGHASLRLAQQAIAQDWPTAGTKVIEVGSGLKSTVTHAATHSAPKPTAAAAGCSPKTSGGNCYKAGEFCPAADHNDSGTAASGAAIKCEQSGSRWRWLAA
jgi:hypothetical protein